MTRYKFSAAAAVAVLTFGVVGPEIAPAELDPPSLDGYMVIAGEDAAESAKMGEDEGTQSGEDADTSETETKKIDQPDRDEGEPADSAKTPQ